MRRAVKLMIFLLAATIDIRLNAEIVSAPADCMGKSFPCAIENNSKGHLGLRLKEMTIHLGHQAIIEELGPQEASLTLGVMFARHKEKFNWVTPFGIIECNACEVLMKRERESVEINTVKGEVYIRRRGDDEKYILPVGFSVSLGSISTDGRAQMEFPQAAPLRPMAKAWASVFADDPKEFRSDLKEYIVAWKQAVEIASQMHLNEAEKQIRLADQAKQDQLNAQRIRDEYDRKLRHLFREKNDL